MKFIFTYIFILISFVSFSQTPQIGDYFEGGVVFWIEEAEQPTILICDTSSIFEYNNYGILLVIIGGFSPFPYKITCLASGFLGVDFILFFIFSFISRGTRFFLVCYLLSRYHYKANELIPKYIGKMTILLIIIVIFYILVEST